MRELVRIAARNLVRNRRRTLLAGAAVFLGVGVMLSMRGMLNGVQGSVIDDVVLGQMGALQIHKTGYLKQVLGPPLSMDIPADGELLARVRAVPGVTAAAPRIVFGGMVNVADTTLFAMVTAVDPALEPQVTPRRARNLTSGALPAPGDRSGSLLAAELARRLGLQRGGQAAVLASDRDGVLNGVDIVLRGTQGLPGAPGMDAKMAVIPLELAQDLLRMPGRATEIAVAVADRHDLPAVRAGLQRALGPGFEVSSWEEIAPTILDVVLYQNTALSVVASIFLFVALLGIANAMLMNVLERTREIGTMMAVGMRRRRILALFLVEAGMLALVFATVGALAGKAFVAATGARGLTLTGPGGGTLYIHPQLTSAYAALIVGVACLGALAAALWPAWKASRMRPVEALTHT